MMDPCIAYMDNSPSRDTLSGLPERIMSRGLGVERLAQDCADADLLVDEIDEGRAGTTMIENFLAICRRQPPETRE